MTKIKLLVAAVCLLVAVNLFMMWQLAKPPRFNGPENQKIIIEKLGLDANQEAQYDQLVGAHKRNIRMYDDSMKALKKELYTKSLVVSDTAGAQAIIQKITEVQQSIEWVHYGHFEDIRALCRPDQLPAFEELAIDLSSMFNPHRPIPKGPRP